jgi:nucleoside-diphosphate-sugar epimerase
MVSLVIGGSGKIGGYIVKHLIASGETPFALSRQDRSSPGTNWLVGDLRNLMSLPSFETVFCTANAMLFADALPRIITPRLRRVVVFTTTSVMTKMDSEIGTERVLFEQFVEAEETIRSICERNNIGWTILRPTLVYDEGKDRNITRLARTIRKFGIMPVVSGAQGLRQPVHAEDLATAAIIASHSDAASNKTYVLAGTEIITYKEMIGRIFDGVGRRRFIIPLPETAWRFAFKVAQPFLPGFNVAMGMRMTKDMTFDTGPARHDLGWRPRDFRPRFVAEKPTR